MNKKGDTGEDTWRADRGGGYQNSWTRGGRWDPISFDVFIGPRNLSRFWKLDTCPLRTKCWGGRKEREREERI